MINFKKTLLAASVSLAMVSGAAMADAWTVTQTYTASGAATSVTQTGASVGAEQSINSINLSDTESTVNNATQSVNITGFEFKLTQDGTTATSLQTGNNISAHTITDATQSIVTANNIALAQDTTTGGGNTQAANHASSAAVLTNIQQNLNPTGGTANITLQQGVIGENGIDNVQAGNNVVVGAASTAVAIEQNANIGASTYLLTQGTMTTGIDNEQAVNRINMDTNTATLGGAADSVTQEMTAITGDINFDQDGLAGAGSVQAGNLINAGTTSATAGGVKQTISVLTSNLDQLDTEAVLQAGNALVTGQGAGGTGGITSNITQAMTVAGASVFLQTNAAGSHQAGNYVGVEVQ